jgi:hypothetical protein
MRMVLSVDLCRSRFSCFCSDIKRWCWGHRSHTSSILIIHQPMMHLATSLCLPLVLSFRSMGDLAIPPPSSLRLVVVPLESSASDEPTSEVQEALV